jgi:flagellar biosynthesis anti-sigma factor FlgM
LAISPLNRTGIDVRGGAAMDKETNMVTPIGSMGASRPVDQLRVDVPKPGVVARPVTADVAVDDAAPTNPAAVMAAAGAPVDAGKVAQIKAALASGSYAIDPKAIADKMIALDLPAHA